MPGSPVTRVREGPWNWGSLEGLAPGRGEGRWVQGTRSTFTNLGVSAGVRKAPSLAHSMPGSVTVSPVELWVSLSLTPPNPGP